MILCPSKCVCGRGGATPRFPLLYFSGQNPPYDGIRTLPQNLFGGKGLIKGQPPLQTVFSLSLMVPMLATEQTESCARATDSYDIYVVVNLLSWVIFIFSFVSTSLAYITTPRKTKIS